MIGKEIKARFLMGWYEGRMKTIVRLMKKGYVSSDQAFKMTTKWFVKYLEQYKILLSLGAMEPSVIVENELIKLLLMLQQKEEAQA